MCGTSASCFIFLLRASNAFLMSASSPMPSGRAVTYLSVHSGQRVLLNAVGSTLLVMTPNHCTTSLGCVFVWWRAPKNCIAHHLALPSSFCFATARSNEQNDPEHPITPARSSELPHVSRRVLQLQALTIVWMTAGVVVSLGAALRSHSPSLIPFSVNYLITLLS